VQLAAVAWKGHTHDIHVFNSFTSGSQPCWLVLEPYQFSWPVSPPRTKDSSPPFPSIQPSQDILKQRNFFT
jgi:hypothetical protein